MYSRVNIIMYSEVTVDIFYYMPDYNSLIQEFIWQTTDVKPDYPRVHKFLNYWKDNIDAIIKEIVLMERNKNGYGNVRWNHGY